MATKKLHRWRVALGLQWSEVRGSKMVLLDQRRFTDLRLLGQHFPPTQLYTENPLHHRSSGHHYLLVPSFWFPNRHHGIDAHICSAQQPRRGLHAGLLVRYCSCLFLHYRLDDPDGQHAGILLGPLSAELCPKRQSTHADPTNYVVLYLAWRWCRCVLQDRVRLW